MTLGFDCITGNVAGDCTIGEAQMTVEITDPGGGLIDFTFRNVGLSASSITDVYWDDETLLAVFSITNGLGVQFAFGASPPQLPGGNGASPPFVTTAELTADSDAPAQPNGVNPGEILTVRFMLVDGKTFADAIADVVDGDLRVGIHVQGYASGGSEALVSAPEPGTFALVGGGLLAMAAARRRRS